MGKTLAEIAEELKRSDKKVQLIYAFNGVGKTRLSCEFKNLIAPKDDTRDGEKIKIIYYNAFTEDLFYWDNDLYGDKQMKLMIRPNFFLDWIFNEQGRDKEIVRHFQHYTNDKLTPVFNDNFSEVVFSYDGIENNIKISKGEESNFVWCVFYSLIEQAISERNITEMGERSTDKFNDLEYIFIDDPVSSLDENHLIELAVNIARLTKDSSPDIKFIITTHNPLFYNILYNEIGAKTGFILKRLEDGSCMLDGKNGDSNSSFSYHIFLKQTIEEAIKEGTVQKYHFTLLRNLYEKMASFLGYSKWSDILPDDESESRKSYYRRIMNFTSHSTLSSETVAEPTEQEKKMVGFLLNYLVDNYKMKKEENTK